MVKKLFARFWELGRSTAGQEREYYESILPLITYSTETRFPQNIHQMYFGGELPPEVQLNIEEIRKRNPNYSYKLWREDEVEAFIVETYGEPILKRYQRIDSNYLAARADFVRYLLLYAFGGLYLDVKSNLLKPLDEVLRPDCRAILSHWDNLPGQDHEGWIPIHKGLEYQERGEYVQWVLVYRSGHPLLREVILEVLRSIDNYNPFVNSIGRGGVLSTTGPIPYNRAIQRIGSLYREHYVIEELPELGFVYSIYHAEDAKEGHKDKLPSNYWTLSTPVVSSPSRFIQLLSTLALKLYYFILDNIVYRLQGKSR